MSWSIFETVLYLSQCKTTDNKQNQTCLNETVFCRALWYVLNENRVRK